MNLILSIPGYLLAAIRAIVLFLLMIVFLGGYFITVPIRGNTPERAFRLRRRYIRIAQRVIGMRLEHHGHICEEPALYISNHRSLSDPLATCRFVDAYVIAKAEVGNIPILSGGAKFTGVIFVQRDNKSSRSFAREKLVETLKNGYNVLVYPEGTVSGKVKVLPYKPGSLQEAINLGIPIVPIAIEYKHPKGIWIDKSLVGHFLYQFSRWRTHVYHEIGQPLKAKDGLAAAKEAEDWTLSRMGHYLSA